ncbi:HtaA domain-containing protein, partial [Corynebacterium marambiense]
MTKKAASLIAGTALLAGSVLVPSAFAGEEAAECVTSVSEGSSSWSVKQTYLNYLTLPITKGEVIVSDGVTIEDAKKGPFKFEVDPERSSIESASKGVFGLKGTVIFHGHKKGDKWELDQSVSDVKIVVDGTSGQIIADYTSVKYPNEGNLPPYAGDDEVIASVTWDKAPNLVAGNVDLSGAKVLLSEKGASELFGGFYTKGQEMAPVSVKAALEEKCMTPEPTTTTAEPTTTTTAPTTTAEPTT